MHHQILHVSTFQYFTNLRNTHTLPKAGVMIQGERIISGALDQYIEICCALQNRSPQMKELNKLAPLSTATNDQYTAITWKWCKTGHKLALFTNTKLHMGFWSAPKSVTPWVTMNGPMSTYHTIQIKRQLLELTASNSMKLDPYFQRQKASPGSLAFCNIQFMGVTHTNSTVAELPV